MKIMLRTRLQTSRRLPVTSLRSRSPANESGFASLVVGLVLVVVLALLTVGFAQLSLHEQRQALDNQLASQAYYAAESGINDALSDMTTNINPATGNPYITPANASATNCMTGLPAGALTSNPVIDAATNVSYSCLLVNFNTNDLEYTNVQPDDSRTTVTASSQPLDKLTISWASTDNRTALPAAISGLKTAAAWAYPAVLQFSITPLGSTTRNNLIDNSITVYAYPQAGGSNTLNYQSYASNPGGDGQIVGGQCAGAITLPYTQCSIVINGLNTATGPYLIHFTDFYDVSNVQITGESGGSPVTLSGGQASIDVTGKAKDVLKRLQVRVPLGGATLPNFALEAQNICKRLETNPAGTTFINAAGGAVTTGICALDQ
jgi:type IV pilus assembly PilX-like protein